MTDAEVVEAFQLLSQHRGHHPRARAGPRHRLGGPRARRSCQGRTVLVNLSGRGDKDVAQMMDLLAP